MLPMIMIVVNLSSVAVVWFGGHLITGGSMEVGALTAFIAYILQILLAIMMAMYVLSTAPRAAVCAERIQDVLDTEPSVRQPQNPQSLFLEPLPRLRLSACPPRSRRPKPAPRAAGEWSSATSGSPTPGRSPPSWPTSPLPHVPGTTTAIIGATGSGKTTLLNLLPRFLNATAGEVSLGGVDVRTPSAGWLRERISIVPQQSHLFSGTVASNLRMAAPEATRRELWQVLQLAQAEDFVRRLPDGLHAAVARAGPGFRAGSGSGSASPAPCSAPRTSTSLTTVFPPWTMPPRPVREAMAPALAAATVLVVAERIPTIMGADRILVLDGRPAGCPGDPRRNCLDRRPPTGRSPNPSWPWTSSREQRAA
jgi:ATP-binding cassette subfamily B multidrug efflux pump